ncbi:ATP-binding protein [Paraburkholderia sp. GAS334]|uniref:ATP-binding protein n=1 Tax=Paraburkholderia sp. GAS334 TaxID=3035131 RepID=UPI003D22CD01
MAQVVNNLLSNAFKFTACGKITLSAEVTLDVQNRSVLVCKVCDSGVGMDAALVAKIFSPFVQGEASTSSRFGGTGLGLSICARLCDLMGGHISVESVQGVGSAFTVMIPLAALHDSSATPVQAPVQRGNALVVCQEAETGKFLEPWLIRAGWLTNAVLSKRAAEAYLRTNSPDFVVVTGEYSLEDIDAMRAVRSAPVIWITRTNQDRPVRHGEGLYEVSEFNAKVTLACIERALREWSGQTEPVPDHVTEVAVPDAALQGLVILVAEDNPLNQALVAEQLDTLGCLPIIVGDGRQALAALLNTEVDVVLTDIHMPVMDGHELLARLHESHPDVPVLAFSAVTSSEQADDWRERGFADYVAKPASLKELETALLRLVRSRGIGAAAPAVLSAAAPATASATAPATAPATAAKADAASATSTSSGMSVDEKARYMAMLKDYLTADLPRLAATIERKDVASLRQWAHSGAGAFLVVQEAELATQCRELERLCDATPNWTPEMARRAGALHAMLGEQFNIHGDAVS